MLPALLPRGRAFIIGIQVFIVAQLLLLYATDISFWPFSAFTPTIYLLPALAVRAVVVWALNGLDKYEEPKSREE
jgi:hypothetical protein